MKRFRRFAAAVGVALGLTLVALAPQAEVALAAFVPIYANEVMLVAVPNSPLRNCPQESCTVMLYMPQSTGTGPGQGWVTSVIYQNWYGAWCEINYRGTWGWTGCWRLGLVLPRQYA